MKLRVSTLLSVLFICSNVEAELDQHCQVKDKYDGKCMQLLECHHYLSMIQNYESLGLKREEVFNTLRTVNCGYVKANALVCCPMSFYIGNRNISPVTSKTPTVTSVLTTQTPVNLDNATTTTETPPSSTELIDTTAAVAPQTTPKDAAIQVVDREKFKILPEECGRVLTFKYFRGNRTEFDDFPWTTLIEYETPSEKIFGCGGSLIHGRYVLTAAHCVTGLSPSWKVSGVRFGEYDTNTDTDCLPDGSDSVECNEPPVNVAVEEIIIHSGFESSDPSRLHDIALLRLSAFVNFTDNIKPICLPTKNPFAQRHYTAGWGKDLDKDSIRNGTNLKYMSYINREDQEICEKIYAEEGVKISKSHICGGAHPDQKPCIADGGGSLMGLEEIPNLEKRVTAFGVLSINKPATGDCHSGYPSVYTKVLDYMNWILDNLRE